MLRCVLQLLFIVDSVSLVSGCSCLPKEEKDQFCQADFASIVRVNGEKIVEDKRVFLVSEEMKIKPETRDNWIIHNKVYTAINSGICGESLNKNSIYLIAGWYDDEEKGTKQKQNIGLCSDKSFVKMFKTLADAELYANDTLKGYVC